MSIRALNAKSVRPCWRCRTSTKKSPIPQNKNTKAITGWWCQLSWMACTPCEILQIFWSVALWGAFLREPCMSSFSFECQPWLCSKRSSIICVAVMTWPLRWILLRTLRETPTTVSPICHLGRSFPPSWWIACLAQLPFLVCQMLAYPPQNVSRGYWPWRSYPAWRWLVPCHPSHVDPLPQNICCNALACCYTSSA